VRYAHFGEGAHDTTEEAIRSLLAETGDSRLGPTAEASAETIDPDLRTPETYLGYERGQGWLEGPNPGMSDYGAPDPGELDSNQFAFGGRWRVDATSATAVDDATISLRFQARRVFLVLGSPGRPRSLGVELDGGPIEDRFAGEDVSGGEAQVSSQRLYRLVDLPDAGDHTVTLRFEPGISGYAFTFG
jgi:hypothetical protein